MESKYTSKKTNESAQYVYTNDVYDLTINNTNGNLAPNLEAKGNDATTVIRQLVEDLSTTTVKLETLMNVFSECIKNGILPEEVSNYISTYIYETPTESSKKSK
ncbi:MAG: hypothetical protein HFI86_04330 [Bacilli bacterium]|nr:hypothetical protein [Bacilli bacterium]